MANPTALDLIEAAYSMIGIWDTTSPLTPYETQLGLTTLSDMLDEWDNRDLMVYCETPFSFPFQNGIQTYQLGSVNPFFCNILGDVMTVTEGNPGAVSPGNVLQAPGVPVGTTVLALLGGNQYQLSFTAPIPLTGLTAALCYQIAPQTNTVIASQPIDYLWNMPRPVKIDRVSILFPSGTDQPVEIEIPQVPLEDWIRVPQKNTISLWPQFLYDDCSVPNRNLRFWPVPEITATCTLWVWEQLGSVGSLTEQIYAPPGYSIAMKLSLAEVLALHFERILSPDFHLMASRARNAINNINQGIPHLRVNSIWSRGGHNTLANESRGRVRI